LAGAPEEHRPSPVVFVGECSTNVALTTRYARAPRGERAYGEAPRGRGSNVTHISSLSLAGVGPALSIEGSSDGEPFGLYPRSVLCPALKRGQIVVMDNLSVHKSARVRELVEAKGAEVLFLAPYSPDFNPIEEAFSKIEGSLRGRRRGRSRLFRALWVWRAGCAFDTKTALGCKRCVVPRRS